MRLALCLGRTLAELGRTMSAAEFAAWVAYDRVEGVPWPWMQTGINTSSTVNLWLGKKARPARATDFMPVKRRKARQTPAQMLAIFRAIARPRGT